MKSSLVFILLLSACQPSLDHQPKIGVLEEPRTQVEGTVAYASNPTPLPKITRALIERGHERYEIYCSVCHGLTGAGDGLATQRGFGAPTAFAAETSVSPSLKSLAKLIAEGQGRMNGFANRISYSDRYAVAVYLQVLRLRSHFPVKALTPNDRIQIKRGSP